jgi:hypothetical protein
MVSFRSVFYYQGFLYLPAIFTAFFGGARLHERLRQVPDPLFHSATAAYSALYFIIYSANIYGIDKHRNQIEINGGITHELIGAVDR